MRIAIGSDHRGADAKEAILRSLKQQGHELEDVGTDAKSESVDYPDYAGLVCARVADGSVDRGILICGTGIGMSIAANKYAGIRAAPIHDEVTAEMSRRHNHLNVLCLAADLLDLQQMERIVQVFLTTEFEGGRHERRIRKIADFERRGS